MIKSRRVGKREIGSIFEVMTKKFLKINVRYQIRDPGSSEDMKGEKRPHNLQMNNRYQTLLTNTTTIFSDFSGQIKGGGGDPDRSRGRGRKTYLIYTGAKLRIIFNYTRDITESSSEYRRNT